MDPDRAERVTEYPPPCSVLWSIKVVQTTFANLTASMDLPHNFCIAIHRNDSLQSSDPRGDPHEELSKAEKGNSSITTSTGLQSEGKRI